MNRAWRFIKNEWHLKLLSILVGLCLAFVYYGLFFLSEVQSIGRAVFYSLYLVALFLFISYILIIKYAMPKVKSRFGASRSQLAFLLGVFLFGQCLAFAIPIKVPSIPADQRLKIIATGDKNPNSQGFEVWIVGLFTQDGVPIDWDTFQPGPGWIIRDNQYLIVPDQQSALLWENRVDGNFQLKLTASPWSGIVKIDWNGEGQIVDLYSETNGTITIDLPSKPFTQASVFRNVFLISSGIAISLVLLCLSLWILDRRGQRRQLKAA